VRTPPLATTRRADPPEVGGVADDRFDPELGRQRRDGGTHAFGDEAEPATAEAVRPAFVGGYGRSAEIEATAAVR
jgi:hypothetical protein